MAKWVYEIAQKCSDADFELVDIKGFNLPLLDEVQIDARGIWTGVKERDDHLRSADFLDVDHYPEITFTGPLIEPDSMLKPNVILESRS